DFLAPDRQPGSAQDTRGETPAAHRFVQACFGKLIRRTRVPVPLPRCLRVTVYTHHYHRIPSAPTMLITRLSTLSDNFARTLRALLAFDASQDESIERATADILRHVQEQ